MTKSCFKDGESLVDYVMVMAKAELEKPKSFQEINFFVNWLQERGLEFEVNTSTTVVDKIFINIHIPSSALKHFAKVYQINIRNKGHKRFPNNDNDLCDTPLSNYVFRRKKGEVTSTERIIVVDSLLNDAHFGIEKASRGIGKLLKSGVLEAAYPLHEGSLEHDLSDENLTDRQLLFKYWANFSMWNKKQPLNLVEKYFGSEIAFYFAWYGFYIRMLIPASILGLFCFFFNVFTLRASQYIPIREICGNEDVLCPTCQTYETCVLTEIGDHCFISTIHYLFDNKISMIFSIFMSLWAAFYLALWSRKENDLKDQWNVEFVDSEGEMRQEYRERATASGPHPVTGDLEPYIPFYTRFVTKIFSSTICFFLIFLVCVVVFLIIILRIQLNSLFRMTRKQILIQQSFWINMCICALIQIMFIKLFNKLYKYVSIWLANLECARTQIDYDKSVILKRYFLGFANNYIPLFYIAFIKGRLYTPTREDASLWGIAEDICEPVGCLMALCIQLIFYLFFKSLAGNIITLITPDLKLLIKKWRKKVPPSHKHQWERELFLESSDKYLLTGEFLEMVLQYGFVTFFVGAFPLAPLCALLNNLLELRLDALKFLTRNRRPVPRRQSGIKTWGSLLNIITYLSAATNACVVAFTTDFIPRAIYSSRHGNLTNYTEGYMLSEFNLTDFEFLQTGEYPDKFTQSVINRNISTCFYRGHRYEAPHELKVACHGGRIFEIGMRVTFVIIFEHVMLLFHQVAAFFLNKGSREHMVRMPKEKSQKDDEHLTAADDKFMEDMETGIGERISSNVKVRQNKDTNRMSF